MSETRIVNRVHQIEEEKSLSEEIVKAASQTMSPEGFKYLGESLSKVGPSPVFHVGGIGDPSEADEGFKFSEVPIKEVLLPSDALTAVADEAVYQAAKELDWSMSPAAVEAGHVKEVTRGVPSDEFPEPSSAVMSTLALDERYVTQEPEPEDNIGNVAEPPDTRYSASAELISQLLKEKAARASGASFEDFRKQVILSFRHLGLDTKKFFSE